MCWTCLLCSTMVEQAQDAVSTMAEQVMPCGRHYCHYCGPTQQEQAEEQLLPGLANEVIGPGSRPLGAAAEPKVHVF